MVGGTQSVKGCVGGGGRGEGNKQEEDIVCFFF